MTKQELLKLLNPATLDDTSYSFVVGSAISAPPSKGFMQFYSTMKKLSFTEGDMTHMLKEMEVHTDEEISSHLKNLLDSRSANPHSVYKKSLMSARYLRQVVYENKHLSKPTLLGLCFTLKLTQAEIEEFFKVAGVTLTNSIPDVLFQVFMEKGIYRLGDDVFMCKLLADETGVTLDDFYYKIYSDDTF